MVGCRQRFTSIRNGRNVIVLKQDGESNWELTSNVSDDPVTQYLYGDAVDELARYETAKANGRLFEMPCVVGDILYRIDTDEKIVTKEVEAWIVTRMEIRSSNVIIYGIKRDNSSCEEGEICYSDNVDSNMSYLDYYLIFTSQEDAIRKLRQCY